MANGRILFSILFPYYTKTEKKPNHGAGLLLKRSGGIAAVEDHDLFCIW